MKKQQRDESKGFYITNADEFREEEFEIPPALGPVMGLLIKETQDKDNKEIIGTLTELILQYPHVPQLKNYLSCAYSIRGNNEKAFEVNKWIVAEHPDYLYGKINLAFEYLWSNQPEKIPEVLGKEMKIRKTCPNRVTFHITEVTAYYLLAVEYYLAVDDIQHAASRASLLINAAPNDERTKTAKTSIQKYQLMKMVERKKREAEKQIDSERTN